MVPLVIRESLQNSIHEVASMLTIHVNTGARFSASLAGLLWKGILAQKGIHVGRWEFARSNMLIILACMIVGCLIVAAEVCVIY